MVASVVVLGVGAGLASLGHLPPPPIAGEPPGPRPEPPQPAGEPPRFAVALRADKPSYIQREPIRLGATLRNAGADEFRVAHYPDQPAATVEYFRVDETGEAAALDKASLSEGVRCGNVDLNVPVTWSIAKGATIGRSYWDENLYEPGSAAFRAAITIEGGAHKGKRFVTDDLRVAIAKPGGVDGKAFEFMSIKEFVPTGNGENYTMNFMGHGLVPTRPAHLAKPLLDLFLSKHGDSLYAQYIRFNLACSAQGEPPEVFAGRFEEILRSAPADFPLRSRAQIFLLQHYLGRSELKKAAEVAKAIRAMPTPLVEPMEALQLDHLMQQVGPRPAATPEELEVVRRADLTVKIREDAEGHWLVKDLTKTLGPQQLASSSANNVNLNFPDRKTPFGLTLDFLYDGATLKELGLRGGLSSYVVGRLTEPLAALQGEHHLSADDARKTYLWATVGVEGLKGVLTLPGEKRVSFTIPGAFLR